MMSRSSPLAIAYRIVLLLIGLWLLAPLLSASAEYHVPVSLPYPDEIAQLPADGGPDYNRLIHAKSPYLLQHASNPVDWFPWSEEAFALAKKLDKPVFLSVGYSTCHWCHVMKRESFEDGEVAALLNKTFVNIKVDREERPDIDHVYMTATRRLSGQGGWPMTVFMTPDKKPFFAGTYFPKDRKLGRPGFIDLIRHTGTLWKENRDRLVETAETVTRSLQEPVTAPSGDGAEISEKMLSATYRALEQTYDNVHGGFGEAPKFPTPHKLGFLLRYWKRTQDPAPMSMVEKTLNKLRSGGIYDHIGFGFHRYATGQAWLVPHFEKMLYDQAMLTMAYTEAFQATGNEWYASVVSEILSYVEREMTSREGGFYSGEDAESSGEEGLYYYWGYAEVIYILGPEDGKWFNELFNITVEGNFVDPTTRRRNGKNIPHLSGSLEKLAAERGIPLETLTARVDKLRRSLLEVRESRPRPLKDDKILTDWNGLMIAALAKVGMALDKEDYITAASRSADFLLDKLRQENGRLWKRYRLGEAGLPAHLDDYAFFSWGLLDLYEATFDVKYLQAAIELTQTMLDLFWDDSDGGFFMTAKDGEKLLIRGKVFHDHAMPSGNSVAALNLIRLYHMGTDDIYLDKAERVFASISTKLEAGSSAYCQMMQAVDFAIGPSVELVIAGVPGSKDLQPMLRAAREGFFPNKVTLFRPDNQERPAISRLAPFTLNQRALNGKATAYLCRNFACMAPSTDPNFVREALQKIDTNTLPGKSDR